MNYIVSRLVVNYNGYMEPDNLEDIISKPNRRRIKDEGKGEMNVGPKPPTGVHIEDRKIRDKRRNLVIKKLVK